MSKEKAKVKWYRNRQLEVSVDNPGRSMKVVWGHAYRFWKRLFFSHWDSKYHNLIFLGAILRTGVSEDTNRVDILINGEKNEIGI